MSEEPKKFKLGEKVFKRDNLMSGEELRPPIDVFDILRENQQASVPTEKPPSLERQKSRRARDYWLTLVAGNAAIATLVAVMHKNLVVLVFGLSGAVVFSIGLTWVMWVVMDDH